jgi:hypothetical protein
VSPENTKSESTTTTPSLQRSQNSTPITGKTTLEPETEPEDEEDDRGASLKHHTQAKQNDRGKKQKLRESSPRRRNAGELMVVMRHPGGMTAPPSNDGYILKWEI